MISEKVVDLVKAVHEKSAYDVEKRFHEAISEKILEKLNSMKVAQAKKMVEKDHDDEEDEEDDEDEINESIDPAILMTLAIGSAGMAANYIATSMILSPDKRSTTNLSMWGKIKNILTGSENKLLKKITDLAKEDPDIDDVLKNGLTSKGLKAGYRSKFENALKRHGLEKEWKKLGDRLSRYAKEKAKEK